MYWPVRRDGSPPPTALINGISAEPSRADTGYDMDAIVTQAIMQKMSRVHPTQKQPHRAARMRQAQLAITPHD